MPIIRDYMEYHDHFCMDYQSEGFDARTGYFIPVHVGVLGLDSLEILFSARRRRRPNTNVYLYIIYTYIYTCLYIPIHIYMHIYITWARAGPGPGPGPAAGGGGGWSLVSSGAHRLGAEKVMPSAEADTVAMLRKMLERGLSF